MILATQSGDRELRLFEIVGSFIPRPGTAEAMWGGSIRTPALQLATVACAVKLISEEIASMVLRVYEGDSTERQPVLDAPQARLFQEPAEGWTSFDVWSDVITSIELERNAFLWKVWSKKLGLAEIYPVDPAYFRVRRLKGTNRKVIECFLDGVLTDVTAQVIQIRGWSHNVGAEGISTPEMHTALLKTATSYEDYRGRWFDGDGNPTLVLEVPGQPNKMQRGEILEAWAQRHKRRPNRIGLAWAGMKVTPIATTTLRDAQAHEVADAIARDVARAYRIYPSELLHVALGSASRPPSSAELWTDLFYRWTAMPRLRRVERALAVDRQMFPDPRLYPRFDPSEFIRGDLTTTANVVHQLVQGGVITKNEGRAMFGMPPIPGGDVLIEIPVGGGGGNIGPDSPGIATGDPEDDDEAPPSAPESERAAPWRMNGHGELVRNA